MSHYRRQYLARRKQVKARSEEDGELNAVQFQDAPDNPSSGRGNAHASGLPRQVAGNPIDADGSSEDSWLNYEYQLCVDVPPTSFQTQLDKMKGKFGRMMSGASPPDGSNCEDKGGFDGSTQRLCRKLEKAFSTDRLMADPFSGDGFIADPYGVGDAMPPASDWISWALNLAENYPAKRTKKITEELQNACELNKHVLDALGSETQEGYSGSRAYVCALNYFLHDAVARCSLPLPPGINLKVAIDLRGGDPLYKAQMRSWSGYKMRVLGIVEMINKSNDARIKKGSGGDGQSIDSSFLTEVLPPKKLRSMSAEVIRSLKTVESKYPIESCSDEDDGYHGVGEREYYEGYGLDTNTENGLAENIFHHGRGEVGFSFPGFRGVLSCYESSGDEDDYSSGSDNLLVENRYRYPEDIQFYKDGGYSTGHKSKGGVKVEASRDGREYSSEAIPDISLRASEGNLAAVKRIVEAAAAVSDREKVATVNKARVWIKLNYNETKYCELYDATPLAYACLAGHHDVVQYLLEQGADPTLRGTMPPSWSVNARGAVHKLYGKIDRGEFSFPELMIMKKCSARCEQLLFAARPFWKPAFYCGDSCYGNARMTFSNAPTDIGELQLALKAVPTIDELPLKRTCVLCCRKKSMNCFTGHSSKCDHCTDIEKSTWDRPTAAQAPASPRFLAFGIRSAAENENAHKRICLLCCRKKSLHCYTGQSNECDECTGACERDTEDYDEGESGEYCQSESSRDAHCEDEDQTDFIGNESYASENEEEEESEYYAQDQLQHCEEEGQSDFSCDEGYEDQEQLSCSDEEYEDEDYSHCDESDEGTYHEQSTSEFHTHNETDCNEDHDDLLKQSEDGSFACDEKSDSESNESDHGEERESEIVLPSTSPRTFFFGGSSKTSGFVTPSPNSTSIFNGFNSPNSSEVGVATSGSSNISFNIGKGGKKRTPDKSQNTRQILNCAGNRRIIKARRPSGKS